MKKIIVNLVLILAFVCGFSTVRAKAYSVELVKNGIYAKYIPENVMKNAPVLFKKNVDKVMKYYEKHKNESDYDFLQKVPLAYKDLHDAVGDLKDNDKIVICNPFIIYDINDEDEKYTGYTYYFVVKKNNEKVSLFTIYVEEGKIKFDYDKIWDKYTGMKNKITDNTLFYWMNGKIYAQTKNKNEMVYDGSGTGGVLMGGSGDNVVDHSAVKYIKFKKLSYDEKKKIITKYLKNTAKISGRNGNSSGDKKSKYVCGNGTLSDKNGTNADDGLDLEDEVSDDNNQRAGKINTCYNGAGRGNNWTDIKKTVAAAVGAVAVVIVAAGICYKRKKH